ncbi:MAG: hypothetical protein ABFC38_11555 [Methanospirillum sp.]
MLIYMASGDNFRDPTRIQTTNEKKSGCNEGCKYGLIAIGIIFVLLLVVGLIGAMFGGTYSSTQPTGPDSAPVITSAPTTQVRTAATIATTNDALFREKFLASAVEFQPLLADFGEAFTRNGANPTNKAGLRECRRYSDQLQERGRFWHDTLQDIPVSSALTQAKVHILDSYKNLERGGAASVTGLDYCLAEDYDAALPYLKLGTSYVQTAQSDMEEANADL